MLILTLLEERLAVCRLDAAAEVPDWATAGSLFSVTRTAHELSVVCPAEFVPAGVKCEKGWHVFDLGGPFEFSEVGILSAVTAPLAEAGVGIFAVSTFDTDYVPSKGDGWMLPPTRCAGGETRSVTLRRRRGERGMRLRFFIRLATFVFEAGGAGG